MCLCVDRHTKGQKERIHTFVNQYKFYEVILYVIQLSDRVYNVTFPAYDLTIFPEAQPKGI